MQLRILSPDKPVYEGVVSEVMLPGTKGIFTILDHHAPLFALLTSGEIRYKETPAGEEKQLKIAGGMVEVNNNVVSVCLGCNKGL